MPSQINGGFEMDQIIRVLIERLVGKGMEISNIPAYIRDLANSVSANGYSSLQELNGRLEMLGWDDFELDDHTLQLIMANFETDSSLASRSSNDRLFDGLFHPERPTDISN
jgi:hypothetical protein